MASGITSNPALNGATPVDTPLSNAGGAGPGGYLNTQKDQKESSTAPKFGEIMNQMQAKFGAKAEKQREIKKVLGKDDFLRIMVTQMRNQDPTSPFKPEQMAAEMAQFTSVEQLQNVNQNLNKMTTANQPLERMAMTNMIGKVVTIDRERFPHTEGNQEALGYSLPKNASQVKVSVVSENGETVYDKDLGPQNAGEGSFTWDGKKENTIPAKTGGYMVRVDAKDEKGQAIPIGTQGQTRIVGVSFEGSEPVFLVGDSKHQEKITMRNIIRVEVDGGQLAAPSQPQTSPGQAPGPAVVPTGGGPTFFTYKKGEGSSSAPPEVANIISQIQAQNQPLGKSAAPAAAPVPAPVKAEGFPNGLHEEVASSQPSGNLNSGNVQGILKKGGE